MDDECDCRSSVEMHSINREQQDRCRRVLEPISGTAAGRTFSQASDGSPVILVMSAEKLQSLNLKIRACIESIVYVVNNLRWSGAIDNELWRGIGDSASTKKAEPAIMCIGLGQGIATVLERV